MATALKSTHQRVKLGPLPDGWTEHKAPTGHTYYYNAGSGQSTYARPAAPAVPPPAPPVAIFEHSLGTNGAHYGAWPGGSRSVGQGPNHSLGHSGQHEQRRHEPKDRPKSKKVIPGANPWLLVYTKLGRRFVHNPESNESLWKFPADVLKCVVELDRKERERRERRDRGEPSESEEEVKDAPTRKAFDSDEYEEVEVTDDEDEAAASKRPRLETQIRDEEQPPPGPVEFNEDDMAYQLAAMGGDGSAYGQEDDWNAYEPPLDEADARALFFDLLDDHHINPYTPWASIVEKGQIIDDERYLCLPNMKSRRETFEVWSSDRIQKLKEVKAKQEKKDPRIPYLVFLQRHATPKLYWAEFRRKYRREPELRDTKLSDKDREKLYREHINRLKLPESTLKADMTTLLKSLPLKDLNRSTDMNMLPPSLLTDIRYISLAEAVRDPLIEGYISMQPEAPDPTDQTSEVEAELAKMKLARERREKALKDRERRVQEERRKREIALRISKSEARVAEEEINQAMKVGRKGLLSHYEEEDDHKADD